MDDEDEKKQQQQHKNEVISHRIALHKYAV